MLLLGSLFFVKKGVNLGNMNSIDTKWVQDNVLPRKLDGHKKTFGHVLVVAGSEGKCGAAILTVRAALHTGCGMVTALIPKEAITPLLASNPEVMYATQGNMEGFDLSQFDSIAIGPGLGFSELAKFNLNYILTHYNGPVIIDADALTLLVDHLHLLKPNHIITPHPKEFARLQGFEYIISERVAQANAFSKKFPSILVLKGKGTLVLAQHEMSMINNTGNDGLATAGSGDVLTGIIASLCAQGYTPFHAACIGVFLHGLAADIAIKHQSKASLVASDIISYLGQIRLID
jgi:hydroxyethylthiazole kinase-like uncharacterized protein yjeF